MPMLQEGGRLGSFPYQVKKILNQIPGNMSEVCIAAVPSRGDAADSLVVIKLAAGPEDRHENFYQQSLLNEERRLKQLKHPGIVRIFPIQFDTERRALTYSARAMGLAGKPWFLVMELLHGGSLTMLIRKNEIDIGQALEIARALAATLDYLHGHKQVHLDIKPDNVLFRTAPAAGRPVEPVLIDFGIARDVGQMGLEAKTPHYASPERVHELREPGRAPERRPLPHPSMDIYALGVVLYEMLTGVLPFQGLNERSLLSSILAGSPKPPSAYNRKVNQELDAFVLKMMAKEPGQRPAAGETAMELEDIAIRSGYMPRYPTGADSAGALVAPPSRSWVTKLLLAILAVLVVLQIAFIAGTRPYWNELLVARNPLSVLWQNLSNGGDSQSDASSPATVPTATATVESQDGGTSTADNEEVAGSPSQVGVAEDPAVELPTVPSEPASAAADTSQPASAVDVTASTPTRTATAVPAVNTATPIANTPSPTATPTTQLLVTTRNVADPMADRERGPATATARVATSTPIPPTPTSTATIRPTASPRVQQAAVPSNLSVDLLSPAEGAALSGSVMFMWRSSSPLPEGYGYEVFRWDRGASRALGQAMAQPTTSTSQSINLDLLGLISNQRYFWGVRLVRLGARSLAEADPRFLGAENEFVYRASESSNGEGSASETKN